MAQIERLCIGTSNQAKSERYKRILSGVVRDVSDLSNFSFEKPEENGTTAEQNAKTKAIFYAEKTGFLTLSEDEALLVDFVDYLPEKRQPGVFVRRIAGKEEATDSELLKYWASIIAKVPEKKRTGRWHFAYCLATPHGIYRTSAIEREVRFYHPQSVIRIPGYPLSSLQGSIDFNRPNSEYTDFERRQIENEMRFLVRSTFRKMVKGLKAGRKVINYIK